MKHGVITNFAKALSLMFLLTTLATRRTTCRAWQQNYLKAAAVSRMRLSSALWDSTLSVQDLIDTHYQHHPEVSDSLPHYDSSKPYFPIYYNDVYRVDLPRGHRFPMEKYRHVRERIQEYLGPSNEISSLCVSPLASWDELTTTHASDYVERFLRGDMMEDEVRNVGFPWSPSGVKRALSSTGGTIAAARAVCEALSNQKSYPIWSAHVAGGTHHAFYDRGEGFCVFSDIAVAANVIRQEYPHLVKRILILDLDVHQGNGNAVLFQGRQDVVTFSMHCEANYFSPKESSDLDIELPLGCTDETYLATLRHWLKQIKTKGGNFDLVFFQAGVDVLKQDRLGRMNLTVDGVRRRNDLVFQYCLEQDLPLIVTMGGGYPHDSDWNPILDAHTQVYIGAHKHLQGML
jgi:acetoin utilization deacetylase AcuC-like enzyme